MLDFPCRPAKTGTSLILCFKRGAVMNCMQPGCTRQLLFHIKTAQGWGWVWQLLTTLWLYSRRRAEPHANRCKFANRDQVCWAWFKPRDIQELSCPKVSGLNPRPKGGVKWRVSLEFAGGSEREKKGWGKWNLKHCTHNRCWNRQRQQE